MISSVLQNYLRYQPFVVKTTRYHLHKLIFLPNVLFFHIKQIYITFNSYNTHNTYIIFIKFIYDKQFINPFWLYFKRKFSKKFGIYSNNLSKSFLYHFFYQLNNLIPNKGMSPLLKHSRSEITKNVHPLTLLTFSFHKSISNSYAIFMLYFNLEPYFAFKNTFKLYYSFLFFKRNFYLLILLNNYYLKLRHF